MKMRELVRYGIPEEVVRLWEARESARLLPLQVLAIRKHGALEGGNLLIQAPTSSGKTFVGEMAAVHTALRRKKAVYLAPLKALAEEKYADFSEKYADYGLEVIVSTRDHRQHDRAFEEGNFSLAVVVYEKLAQLLVRRPERMQEIELLIADELELLSDPERGPTVELLLTHAAVSHCRLIGLSAVLGDAGRVAEWLGAELLDYDRRPVELRTGVFFEGAFRYRTVNTGDEGCEPLAPCHAAASAFAAIAENVALLAGRGESSLVFVKDRRAARRGALRLADRLDLPGVTEAREAVLALEATHTRDELASTLGQGVAYHSADLSTAERRIVEAAFRAGTLKVLVSTSTLAAGLNLPAHNVFITHEKWQYDRRCSMPWKAPITRSEFDSMAGRAGRYGTSVPFGRAVLTAATPFDQETFWRRYIDGEPEPPEPRLDSVPLEDHLLRLVASRGVQYEGELQAFLECTLTGRWIWSACRTPEEMAAQVRAAVRRLLETGMAKRLGCGRLQPTPLGHAVAAKGIALGTALELTAWLEASERRPWPDLDLLVAAALTPDGRLLQFGMTVREYERAEYPALLAARTASEPLDAEVPVSRFRDGAVQPFFDEVRAVKAALVLSDWIAHTPVYAIEETYQVSAGQIRAAADQISWLIDAAAALARAQGANAEFAARIGDLAGRVEFGVAPPLVPLMRLGLDSLTRSASARLDAEGLSTLDALADAPPAMLTRWLSNADADALLAWARTHRPANERSEDRERSNAPPESPERPALVVDARRPDTVLVDGQAVRLQHKQFKLLEALAARPGECVPYADIYDAVWGASVVETGQMSFQKRRLAAAIRAAAPARAKLIRTLPKRGLVLDLRPGEVALLPAPAV